MNIQKTLQPIVGLNIAHNISSANTNQEVIHNQIFPTVHPTLAEPNWTDTVVYQ